MTKLLYGRCRADSTEGSFSVSPGGIFPIDCTISGVDADDSAVATIHADPNLGVLLHDAQLASGKVVVNIENSCPFNSAFGQGSEIGIVVFDK